MEKYYYILGLEPGADVEQIKRAYRLLARICHPDVHAQDADLQDSATILFRRLKDAYDKILTDNRPPSDPPPSRPTGAPRSEKSPTSPESQTAQVRASNTPGPAFTSRTSDYFRVAGERIKFIFGITEGNPVTEKGLPRWADVVAFADACDDSGHKKGNKYYYVIVEPKNFVLLKFLSGAGSCGYLVIFRSPDGKYWFATNDPTSRWQTLALGSISSQVWVIGRAKIFIEVVRPTVDEDLQGRVLDYRFRIEEQATTQEDAQRRSPPDTCPSCRSPRWDGSTCQQCGFYLY